jgi:hypothetical protein
MNPTRGASSAAGFADVHLIDLLAGDVELDGRNGEPAHGREGLDGVQKTAMGSIHPSLSVLGLGERHSSFRFHTTCVLGFMQSVGEPTRRCGLGKRALSRARLRAGQLSDEVAQLFPERRLRLPVLPRGPIGQPFDRPIGP